MKAKKIIFLQMYNTVLQRAKHFLNVKMINIAKIKQENSQFLLLRRSSPTPYFYTLFKIFQIPPPGEVIKIYFPPLKGRGGRGGTETMIIIKGCDICMDNANSTNESSATCLVQSKQSFSIFPGDYITAEINKAFNNCTVALEPRTDS